MNIAFIDDKAENLSAWLSAMRTISGKQAHLSIYQSVDEFEEALAEGYLPAIVFTDYNIDDRCGTEIVEMLRREFGERVYIIAHSSQGWRNEHLLQLGANEIIAKYKGHATSPAVADRFWSIDDLTDLLNEDEEE